MDMTLLVQHCLNRFSIKSRLIASFLVLFALLATVVGVAWLNNARSQVAVKGIVEQDMVKLELDPWE